MATLQELRDFCNTVREQRRKDVESVLTDWLESRFIESNNPWRAIIGNKKCKPIPIHRDFSSKKIKDPYDKDFYNIWHDIFYWPDLPEKEIREIIENLGFIIVKNKCHPNDPDKLCLAVPAYEKGKPLTFAQEWVKKINYNYSLYIVDNRKKAEQYYNKVISKLCESPIKNMSTRDGFTIFENFEFEVPMDYKCYSYLRKLLNDSGIEDYDDEEGNLRGLRVTH